MGRYMDLPKVTLLPPVEKLAIGEVPLTQVALLMDHLLALDPQPVHEACPEPMEKVGQGYGYILYRTHVTGPREDFPLILDEVHDRAEVFVDGVFVGRVFRDGPKDAIRLTIPCAGAQIDVLVMAGGRVNYGPYLADHKGITKTISLGQQNLYHYEIFRLPLTDLRNLAWRQGCIGRRTLLLSGKFQSGQIGGYLSEGAPGSPGRGLGQWLSPRSV